MVAHNVGKSLFTDWLRTKGLADHDIVVLARAVRNPPLSKEVAEVVDAFLFGDDGHNGCLSVDDEL